MMHRGAVEMADAAADPRRAALADLLPWSLSDNAVALSELPFMRQLSLRRRVPSAAYFAGLPLPLQPNRAAAMGLVRVL